MFKEGSLYRVIEISAHVRAHPGIKSKELPERLEVSTRTIYRVVESLRGVGINVSGNHKGYRIEGDALLPSLNLTLEEALTIILAARATNCLENILEKGLEEALAKIRSSLPGPSLSDQGSGEIHERLLGSLHSPDARPPEHLALCRKARA